MKTTLTLVAALAAALAAGGLQAKGVVNPAPRGVNVVDIDGNPLQITVGEDNSFQVYHTDIAGGTIGQIYPSGQQLADMGWLVRVGGQLTAPNFYSHGSTATGNIGPYQNFGGSAIGALSGNGSAATPFTVSTTGTASGLNVTQTISYVNGENFFRKAFTLSNPGGAQVSATVFLASDIYLASSDAGRPFREPNSGSPGGQTCAGVTPEYTILHVPQGALAPAAFTADGYASVWSQIGANALNNTVNPGACLDNGAGLQWNVNVPAGGSVTVQAATSFGAIPVIVGPPPAAAVAAPTLGTWGLGALALAVLALAGIAISRRN